MKALEAGFASELAKRCRACDGSEESVEALKTSLLSHDKEVIGLASSNVASFHALKMRGFEGWASMQFQALNGDATYLKGRATQQHERALASTTKQLTRKNSSCCGGGGGGLGPAGSDVVLISEHAFKVAKDNLSHKRELEFQRCHFSRLPRGGGKAVGRSSEQTAAPSAWRRRPSPCAVLATASLTLATARSMHFVWHFFPQKDK